MEKTGKIIAGMAIAAGIAIAAYYGFFYKFEGDVTGWQKLFGGKKPDVIPPSTDAAAAVVTPSGGTQTQGKPQNSGFPLSKGSRGALVTRLSNALELRGQNTGLPKNVFGKDTKAALEKLGYGSSVADESALQAIEKGVKPQATVAASSSYEKIATGKMAFANKTEKIKSININTNLDVNLQKSMSVGTINKVFDSYVWVDTLAGRVGISKSKLES